MCPLAADTGLIVYLACSTPALKQLSITPGLHMNHFWMAKLSKMRLCGNLCGYVLTEFMHLSPISEN